MKIFHIAACCAVLASLPSTAEAQLMSAGVHVGMSNSNFTGGDLDNMDSRNGLAAGVSLVWQPAGAVLGLETGIGYVTRGAGFQEDGVNLSLDLGYLDIPFLFRVALPIEGRSIVPVFFAGPNIGINLSCKLGGSGGGFTVSADCDDDIWEGDIIEPNTVDFGISGGIGIEIPVGLSGVFAPRISYTRSLTEVFDEADDVKNANFQFGVSYRMLLGR